MARFGLRAGVARRAGEVGKEARHVAVVSGRRRWRRMTLGGGVTRERRLATRDGGPRGTRSEGGVSRLKGRITCHRFKRGR